MTTQSERMKARWADPEWREMMLAKARVSIKKACAASARSPRHNRFKTGHIPAPVTDRAREARRATMKRLNADPAIAQRMAEGRKKRWPYKAPKDPKYRLVREVLGVEAARECFGL